MVRKTEVLLPQSLFADLDRSGTTPLYHQVATKFEVAIRQGTLPPGSRIENEVSLAERLQLSRPTIRRAIQTLVDDGLIVRRRGIGSQVVHGQVTRGMELTSLYDDIQRGGSKAETTVVSFGNNPANAHVAQSLGVPAGTVVTESIRIRYADKIPMAVLHNWIPHSIGTLTKEELDSKGLYQILRERGFVPQVGKQRISARKVTQAEAKELDIESGAAVLTMERTAYDSMGRAIEHGEHIYRTDLYSLEFTVVNK
ncbi:MAG: GntR family transcriptional regulator [Actinobacteria bacterium]|nr:GntR family transcriptional regulator [Actinomycetota bacterium]